jgi:hypothetical protein
MAKRARAEMERRSRSSEGPTRTVSYADLHGQIDRARRHHSAARAAGRVAVSATFDRKTRRVVVEMSLGHSFGIPTSAIPELACASDRQLSRVRVDDLGSGLIWEDLDVQVSVIGVILEVLGERVISAAASRAAGMVITEAKSAAARRNGAKGGRPRK